MKALIKRMKDKSQTGRKYLLKTYLITDCYLKYTESIGDKTVEQKDLSSPPLTKTQKSQLTAEQPLTKKDWDLPEETFYIQRQRRSYNKTVGGVLSQ